MLTYFVGVIFPSWIIHNSINAHMTHIEIFQLILISLYTLRSICCILPRPIVYLEGHALCYFFEIANQVTSCLIRSFQLQFEKKKY